MTEEREMLKKVSTFVINRKSEELRGEIYEFIIGLVLLDNSSGLTMEEIYSLVIKELNVENIPFNLIEKCIEKMYNEKTILRLKRNRNWYYLLSDSEIKKYELYISSQDRSIKKLDERIKFLTIQENTDLGEDEINLILLSFKDLIKNIFSQLSLETCFEIIKGTDLKIKVSAKSIMSILHETVDKMEINIDKNDVKYLYKLILNDDDEYIKDYIFNMAMSYFIIHIMRLDPSLEIYTKEILSKRITYLDTNMIMSSLIGKGRRRRSSINALKLTNKLGIKIKYTNETKKEYLSVISNRKEGFRQANNIPIERYQKVSEYLEDGMLKDYLNTKEASPQLSTEAYFTKLAGFETIIQSRYGAEFDSNVYYDIYETENFDSFVEIIKQEGVSRSLFKSNNVARHDAFHLLLLKKLRSMDEDDVFGPKYWFLTLDNTLYNAEKRFYDPEIHSSITADKWIQIITPLLSPENLEDAKEAYMGLLSSRLPLSTQVIDEEDFLLLQGGWIDDDELSPQNVAKILGNKWLKSYTTDLREENKEINKEDLLKALEPIIKNTKQHDKAIQGLEAKLESVSSKKEELDIEKEKLSAEMDELMKESFKKDVRYDVAVETVGAMLFLLVFYLMFNFFINHLNPWQSFLGSLVISLFFGYLLGFKSYKWLIEKIGIAKLGSSA